MKKLFFSLLALAAVSSGAWATDEITSGTSYYIQNVESGLFLCGANNWGTMGSVSTQGELFKVDLNNATYTLTNQVVTASNKTFGYNLYVDTNTGENGNAWTIAPVDGEPGVFTIYGKGKANKVNNAFDGYLCQSATAGVHIGYAAGSVNPADNTAKWRFLTKEEAIDQLKTVSAGNSMPASFLMVNPNFSRNHNQSGWTVSSDCTNKNLGGGANENMCAESYHSKFTISQNLQDVPNGVYAITAQGFYRQDGSDNENLPYFFANDEKKQVPLKTGSENSMANASASFSNGLYTIDPIFVEVTDGNLNIGIANPNNASLWVIWDNFELSYYGNVTVNEARLAAYIKDYKTAKAAAEAFTEASMAAADWTALQTAITSNTLDLGTATQEQLVTATQNLNAAVAAANSAATNYAELTANTAAVAGADLNNPVVTNFVKNGTFDSNRDNWISTTGAQNQALASNQQGAFTGNFFENWNPSNYTGKIYQEVKNIPNGIYELSICAFASVHDAEHQFVYANDAKVYLTTGAPTAYKVLVQVDNNEVEVGLNQDATVNNWMGIDNVSLTYYGNYTLADVLINTVPTEPMNATVKANLDAAVAALEADKTSQEKYDALVVAISNAGPSIAVYQEINTILTAENTLDAAGKAALDYSAVQTAYNNRTITDGVAEKVALKAAMVVAAKAQTTPGSDMTVAVSGNDGSTREGWSRTFDGAGQVGTFEVNTWSTEADASNLRTPFIQSWVGRESTLSDATITNNSITGLHRGLYKVTIFSRIYSESGEAPSGATFFVGENEVNMTEAGTAFDYNGMKGVYGTYEATAQLDNDDASIAFGVKIKNATFNWVAIKNVTLTYLGNPATEVEKQALSDAIAAVDGYMIGFEDGEYATYNNAAAINARAAAKAIDVDNAPREAVVEATNNLTNATWTPNEGEVNAVYDGTFAAATNDGAPAGWTMSNNTLGGAYHSRAFVGDSRLSEFNSTNSGLFLRFDGTNSNRGSMYFYGNTEGYTMPLKENTTYYVSVDFAGWGSTGKPLRLNVTGPEGFEATGVQANTSVRADNANNAPQNHTIVFTTGPAGNYVINFQTPGADTNTHNVVISNVVLMTASSANMAVNATAKYGTFCAPFAVTIPSGVTAYTVESAGDNGVLNMNEVETTIPANTPVILNAESGLASATVYGKAIAGTPTNGVLTGVYTKTAAPVGSYILQNNNDKVGFYKVTDLNEDGKANDLYVGANRCYLNMTNSSVKAFFFAQDDEDGINAIEALTSGKAEIYNLNGQKLNSLQKGINIVNGKKIMVK